ncbi:hypothetical protein BYT27DRAFT_7193615 [Phlegmacium glaucopus]|nr:hypothetical protein BYT27DRAFT_7193615 [Phlegmacium glaucopus]
MYFELPFIGSYSLKFQLTTLLILLIISYLHRGVRLILAGLTTLYLVTLCFIPLIRWTYYLFKAIALFGFYVHYFHMGIGFIVFGLGYLIEKVGQERRRGRRE